MHSHPETTSEQVEIIRTCSAQLRAEKCIETLRVHLVSIWLDVLATQGYDISDQKGAVL